MTLDDLVHRLDEELPEGCDWGLELTVGREYMWSAELRITPEPHREGAPDRSFATFKAGGGGGGERVATEAVNDAFAWLAEMREREGAEA